MGEEEDEKKGNEMVERKEADQEERYLRSKPAQMRLIAVVYRDEARGEKTNGILQEKLTSYLRDVSGLKSRKSGVDLEAFRWVMKMSDVTNAFQLTDRSTSRSWKKRRAEEEKSDFQKSIKLRQQLRKVKTQDWHRPMPLNMIVDTSSSQTRVDQSE